MQATRIHGWRGLFAPDALLPAALVAYCAFNAGGYFPDTPGVVAAVLLVALALRVAIVPRPFAGWSRAATVAAGALALLGAWTVVSMAWSHAPARAVLEADRVLAYLLTLVVFAASPWRPDRLRRIARGLALACVVVCGAALASRLLPTLWPTAPNIQESRLSYPLTYWNALALLAAIGMTLCAHLVCDAGEPRAVRALGAAAFPLLAATALFTFSRGGLALALLAPVGYALLVRPPEPWRAALAVIPPTLIALVVAYGAGGLAAAGAASESTAGEGARVAAVLAAASLLAAGLTLWLPWTVDRRVRALVAAVPARARPALAAIAAVLALAAVADVAVRQLEGFARRPSAAAATDLRNRLTDPSSNGRTEYWRVAWRTFAAAPLDGAGAGTYQLAWWRRRRTPAKVAHAHSLYLETLAELGAVGLALIACALVPPVVALARRRAGPGASAAGALLAAALAWALHAALDWDWQMPAVTIWLWAAGGAALARSAAPAGSGRPLELLPRAAVALLLMAAAGVPALIAVSENRLEAATAAYEAGDCDAADSRARVADAALPIRSEPLAVQAFCAARDDDLSGAHRLMDRAVARDPDDWELRYDRAVMTAAAGGDPRADLARAARLDPLEPAIRNPGPASAATLFLGGLDEPPFGGPPS